MNCRLRPSVGDGELDGLITMSLSGDILEKVEEQEQSPAAAPASCELQLPGGIARDLSPLPDFKPLLPKCRAGFDPSTELDDEGGDAETNGNASEHWPANGSASGAATVKGGATTRANDARCCRHRRELRGDGWKWLCGGDWEGGCGGGGPGGRGRGRW